jgi:hypothetical protein
MPIGSIATMLAKFSGIPLASGKIMLTVAILHEAFERLTRNPVRQKGQIRSCER